ncbi:MAG: hypothetical protein H6744_04685 [Deltaproteobacteria bacterium]|nr:hypothetical protein [Deltaproteobacteria bacterium]MCB9785972.1 hypothetical protein [Deltaproteobacteria bacterium]
MGAAAGVERVEAEAPSPAEAAPAASRDPEPNDGPETAIPLTPGVAVQGYVDAPADPAQGDQDWYVLQIPEGGPALVSATLSGAPDLDLVLEWMPDGGGDKAKALVQADVHERSPGAERLPALRAAPGPLYLRVREGWYRGRPRTGSAQPYELRVEVAAFVEGAEAEPDDSIEDAVPLGWGEAGRGTMGHIGDRDLWKLALDPAQAGARARVNVTGLEGVELEVSVSRSGEAGVLASGSGGEGGGVTFRNLGLPRDGASTLYVAVRAVRGAAPEQPYDLLVSLEDPTTERVEREPNDGSATATALGEPGRVVGIIDRAGDVDTYALVVDRASTLQATLEAPLGLDLALELRGPDGDGRARIDEGGPGEAELLRGYGVGPGTWTLVVRGHKGAFDPSLPYALDLTLGDGGEGETEPNDDRDAGGVAAIELSKERQGWLHPRGDVDFWRLDLSEREEGLILTVRARPPAGVPMDVALHGPDGVRMSGREGLVPGEDATFTQFLSPGVYHVRVSATGRDTANPRDSYRLMVLE